MNVLDTYQEEAIYKMHNGCVLCAGVGTGKTRTSLAYFLYSQGVEYKNGSFKKTGYKLKDLYIITTALKRDSKDWETELLLFGLNIDISKNHYKNNIHIDSWNNVKKYVNVSNAFFIFDEQRAIRTGTWGKSFIKICKKNEWIMLSATPGDKFEEYGPLFVANGFFKNITEFNEKHVVKTYYGGIPHVIGYISEGRLLRLRSKILVRMVNPNHKVTYENIDIWCGYDIAEYKETMRKRWNKKTNTPIARASELCLSLREIVNSDPSRIARLKEIVKERHKCIVFYNFDYELDILRNADYGPYTKIAEWNGHKHEPVPDSPYWVYLVQYTAGAEGWNCTTTDTVVFYSQNYSYKIMVQAAGRTDRFNTPYDILYYYHFKSRSSIDLSIARALKLKKKFNEKRFVEGGAK